MAQLGTILRARRAFLKNRLLAQSPRQKRRLFTGLAVGALLTLLAGYFAAPALMEPPVDLATPRGLSPDDLPAGAAALEAAFWLTILIASVLNFRVLELLFRRRDVQALRHLPLQPTALFVDRLLAALTEAVVATAAASLFFVPLVFFDGGPAALASVLMLLGGLVLTTILALVVALAATRQLIPEDADGESSKSFISADAYGGQAQILLYAPALSLGGVIIGSLFWKLLLGEPLRLDRFSEPFLIGTGILAAVAFFSLLSAFNNFRHHYYAMAARFQEADAASFASVATYQRSSFGKDFLWSRWLRPGAASVFRALTLDDDRRIAGGRVGYAVVFVLALIGLWGVELAALPLWAVAAIPGVLFAVVVNPWHRLLSRARRLHDPMALPASFESHRQAASRGALREYAFFALPFGVAATLILFVFRDAGPDALVAAALSITLGPAMSATLTIVHRLRPLPGAPRVVPVAVLAGLTTVALVSLPAALGLSLLLPVLALVTRPSEPTDVLATSP